MLEQGSSFQSEQGIGGMIGREGGRGREEESERKV